MGQLDDFFGIFQDREPEQRNLIQTELEKKWATFQNPEPPLEANPWVDPVGAFVGGTAGSLKMGSSIIRGVVNGTIAAVSDIPAGAMIDEVGKVDSLYTLPFAVGLGVVQSAFVSDPLERMMMRGISKVGRKGVKAFTKGGLSDWAGIKSESINEGYARMVDDWNGNKIIGNIRAKNKSQIIRNAIKVSVDDDTIKRLEGLFKWNKLFKDNRMTQDKATDLISMAMTINRDMGGQKLDPKKFADLPEMWQKLFVLSDNLSPAQLDVSRHVGNVYDSLQLQAKKAGFVRQYRQNYINRVLGGLEGEQATHAATDLNKSFNLAFKHGRRRETDLLADHILKGREIKELRMDRLFGVYLDEFTTTKANKAFMSNLQLLTDVDGKLLVGSKFSPDLTPIDHPQFTTWNPAARTQIISADQQKALTASRRSKIYQRLGLGEIDQKQADKMLWKADQTLPAGKNFFTDERGTIWEKTQLYTSDPRLAKNLDNMLGISKLKGNAAIDAATKANSFLKATKFTTSLFHDQALMASYYLAGSPFKHAAKGVMKGESFMQMMNELTPPGAYKAGNQAIRNLEPTAELLIKNRLTVGGIMDWEEPILRKQDQLIEGILKNETATVKAKFNAIRYAHTDWMFNKFLPGLKMKAAIGELNDLTARNTKKGLGLSPNHMARIVAENMNADFGGLNLTALGRSPTVQHVFGLLNMAPDWNESNVRLLLNTLKTGKFSEVGSRTLNKESGHLARKMWIRAIGKTILYSQLGNMLISNVASDDPITDYKKKFSQAVRDGHMSFADINMTPIRDTIVGKDDTRKYLSVGAQFMDPFIWAKRPIQDTVSYKTSMLTKALSAAWYGTDWLDREYTSLTELAETGKLLRPYLVTKYRNIPKTGLVERLPSVTLDLLSTTNAPIPVQNLVQYSFGEMDGFDAMIKSLGGRLRSKPFKIKTKEEKYEDYMIRQKYEELYPRIPYNKEKGRLKRAQTKEFKDRYKAEKRR